MNGTKKLDLAKKTELVDEKVFQALVDLNHEYEGEIKMSSDSDYSSGTIIIKVKE